MSSQGNEGSGYQDARRSRSYVDTPPEYERSTESAPARVPACSPALLANPRLNGRGNSSARAESMLGAQRTQGNRAVQRSMHRNIPVQRDGELEGISDPRVRAWYNGSATDEVGRRYESTSFGNYEVTPGSHRSIFAPVGNSRNQITEAERDRLAGAWHNVESSNAPFINGRGPNGEMNPAMGNRFRHMLAEDMQDSPTLRNLVTQVGNDTAHPFAINVGENQPGTFADSFANRNVDLDDLEAFNTRGQRNRNRNEVSRGEIMTHFLQERYYDATHRAQGGTTTDRFEPAHATGVTAQNQYRTERGQVPVLSSEYTDVDRQTGERTLTISLADGTSQQVVSDRTGRVLSNAMVDASGAPMTSVSAPPRVPQDDQAPPR